MFNLTQKTPAIIPWNKDKLVGQKLPLKLNEIYAIRVRLQIANKVRELALFNLAIDSKLRGCDLVKLKVNQIAQGEHLMKRALILQQKTQCPVQFEITKTTRESIAMWIKLKSLKSNDFLFPSRYRSVDHISTRQYVRLVKSWVLMIGLNPNNYGSHSLRRAKPTLIYKRTHNLRAVQLLLGHKRLESTVRYLGVEVDDALELSEQTEV